MGSGAGGEDLQQGVDLVGEEGLADQEQKTQNL